MSRKPLAEGQTASKEVTFNSLLAQLEEPKSMLSMLPPDMQSAVAQIPEEWINLDEDTLVKKLEDRGKTITPTVDALRNNFWMEYERVAASRKEAAMNMTNVYLGVCSRVYLNKLANESPELLAYITTQSPEYKSVMAGLQSLANRRLRDILNIPIKKSNGEYNDPKLVELVMKAAAMVDLRNNGAYLQRSETKNLTLMHQKNETTSYTQVFTAASSTKSADLTLEDIQSRLKALEEEEQAMLEIKPPEPKFQDAIVDAEFKEV